MRGGWTLCVVAGLALLAGCDGPSAKPPEVRPVRTVTVDPKPIDDDRQAVGEVRARYESDLGFRVSGKVVARLVDVGVSVKKGDVLARLDEQEYRNRLKSARGRHRRRARPCSRKRGAPRGACASCSPPAPPRAPTTTPRSRTCAPREAKLDSAKAARDLAKDQLSYADLVAEFDGIVTAVGAEPGQVVNVGQMVVRLARPTDKDAVFAIAESAFRGPPGAERPEVVVSLLSNPGISADGVVREISPVADPATRTYQVKVTLKDPPDQMRFGASVVGRLKVATAPVVVLPATALFDKAGQPAVWVVDAASGSVTLKPVDGRRATRPTASSSAAASPRARSSSPPASTACARARRCASPRRPAQ